MAKIELKKKLESGGWWYILYLDGERQYPYATEERGMAGYNELKEAMESGQPTEFTIMSEDVYARPKQG